MLCFKKLKKSHHGRALGLKVCSVQWDPAVDGSVNDEGGSRINIRDMRGSPVQKF